MARGWWMDDDGFLRHPDNIEAFDLDDCVKLRDERDAQRDALAEALKACVRLADLEPYNHESELADRTITLARAALAKAQ